MIWVRRAVEAFIGAAICGVLAIAFVLEPLTISASYIDAPQLQRGQDLNIRHDVSKPFWAVNLCRATAGYMHIIDSDGAQYFQSMPFGYNNGNMTSVLSKPIVPEKASLGHAEAWETVEYKCLGFIDRVVYSPHVIFEVVMVAEE